VFILPAPVRFSALRWVDKAAGGAHHAGWVTTPAPQTSVERAADE
jgi:hypothetical protein